MDGQVIAALVVGGLMAALLLRRFLWRGAKLLLRSVLWGAVLAALSPLGTYTGITLGVNAVNALVLGVLGLPGMGLLFLLHWFTIP